MQIITDIQNFLHTPERLGELVGLTGAFVYIGGFFLLQTGRICGNSVVYALSKVVAACLVLISLITAFNLASCVIQIAYAGIGLYGVTSRIAARRSVTQKARRPIALRARNRNRQPRGAVSVLA